MEEATRTITEAITALIEAGGPTALWGLLIYMGLQVLSTLIIAGAWTWIIFLLSSRLLAGFSRHLTRRDQRISILSSKVSNKLSQMLEQQTSYVDGVLTEMQQSVQKLEQIVQDLLGESASSESETETSSTTSEETEGE